MKDDFGGRGWADGIRRERGFFRALRAVAMAWAFAAAGCGAPLLAEIPDATRGSFDAAIEHDGSERTFRMHVPALGAPSGKRPLLVVLHGGGSSGAGMEEVTGFSRIADRERLFVVYPDGTGGPHGLGRAWNAGGCCGPPAWFGVDDVGYIATLLDALEGRWPVDGERIFVIGYSNGGMLAYRLATSMSERFAGLAVYAASMPGWGPVIGPVFDYRQPSHPLTVITIHSYSDPWVAYQGRESNSGTDISFHHVGQFWAAAAGCTRGVSGQRAAGGRAVVRRYTGCTEGAEVKQITLHDWDHEWPGPANLQQLSDHPLREFDAAEEIWRMFSGRRFVAARSPADAESAPSPSTPGDGG